MAKDSTVEELGNGDAATESINSIAEEEINNSSRGQSLTHPGQHGNNRIVFSLSGTDDESQTIVETLFAE